MAEVKDFSSYARKLNNGGDFDDSSDKQASYKEKIRNHKLKVFFRTVAIALFTVFVIAVIYISWRDKEYSEATITIDAAITNGMDSKVISLGDCVVQYSKDGMSCLNPAGQQVWNQTYEMQTPIAHTCNTVVAVGDYNGHHIYVSNTQGALGTIDTNLPIRDFCVSAQGVVAAVLDGTEKAFHAPAVFYGGMRENFEELRSDFDDMRDEFKLNYIEKKVEFTEKIEELKDNIAENIEDLKDEIEKWERK